MLKHADSVNLIERQAVGHLRELLDEVLAIVIENIEVEIAGPGGVVDAVAHLDTGDRKHILVCKVKAVGQPRHVRMAVLQLKEYVAQFVRRGEANATPVFIAPYLSPEARALCKEYGVGYLDFEGNCRLVFEGVFIERSVPSKPKAEQRDLKSLFKPKAARVLRKMLRDPDRAWRVAELAEAAGVSLGHVSNVRKGLLDKEWAADAEEGTFLKDPEALLDSWREQYEPPAGKRTGFYTTLHGSALEEAMREALAHTNEKGAAMLASFSAAKWLAPYARTGSAYLYVDEDSVAALEDSLKLAPASKGENVFITRLKDPGLFDDRSEPVPGIFCTCPVQTYLDLSAAGERGREAAEHLRRELLSWHK